MSAEGDYRAALLAHAPLVALVGQRVALHAVAEGQPLPVVVFTGAHEKQQMLRGAADTRVTFATECWARTAAEAVAVADAVEAAVLVFDTASTTTSATVLDRQDAFDSETLLEGVVLSVEWWP